MDGGKTKNDVHQLMAALVALLNAPVPVHPTCTISKSRYTAGIQCRKRAYLQVHSPELAILDDRARAVMAQGTEVGILARRAFAGGVLVSPDRDHLSEAISHTRELLANTTVPAIFEATFEHDGVLVRIDVLERCGAAYRLIEVKSSTAIKPHYVHDVGIQKYVAEGNGLAITNAHIMHLNRNYMYDGSCDRSGARAYDLSRLFTITEIEPTTSASISRELSQQFVVLAHAEPPRVEPGEQCKSPYECEFYNHCNPALPPNDVRSLPVEGWKVKGLRDRGLLCIDQLPDPFDLRFLYHLTEKECMMAIAAKKRAMRVGPGLAAELARIKYPLCYLDFETLWPALPWFSGMRPYDHIPFQWSLHRREHAGAPLKHTEFLWDSAEDPRPSFARSLSDAVAGANTTIVYNESFEATRLKELAIWLPMYREPLRQAREKLWDLLPVIRRHVYHPDFCGSYALKRVLPALMPGMHYQDLAVAEGSQAGRVWLQLLSATDSETRGRLRDALSAYCAQDTAALACIHKILAELPTARHSIRLATDHAYGGCRQTPSETVQ